MGELKILKFDRTIFILLFGIWLNPSIECAFGAVVFPTNARNFLPLMVIPDGKNLNGFGFTFNNKSLPLSSF